MGPEAMRRLEQGASTDKLAEALRLLLSYTKSCEGLLNASPAGQVQIAENALAAYEAQAKPAPAEPTQDTIDYLYAKHCGDGGPTAICEQFAPALIRAVLAAHAAPAPLTDEQVRRGWASISLHPFVDPQFAEGVRWAEQAHGIGKGGAA